MNSQAIAEYVDQKQENELSTEHADIVNQTNALQVVDQTTMDRANNILTWIVDRQKKIESFRLAIVKPIKDHLRNIDNYFNGWRDRFDEPKQILISRVSGYRAQLEIESRKRTPEAKVIQTAEKTTNHDLGRVTYRKTAEWKISSLDKIPDEFWCVDERKIAARVRELTKDLLVGKKYTDKIPGVTIEVTEKPSVTIQ